MSQARRGFSLIELLVVIFIIIVIVSITIPALAGARKSARKAETQMTLTTLGNAVSQFETDHNGTAPGYFSAREMGRQENATRGFTAMQNILLDLSGGLTTGTGASTVLVGPTAADAVRIDQSLIGTTSGGGKLYFSINRKNFYPQDGTQGARTGVPEHQYPELVDAFGTPIVAWVQDPTFTKAPAVVTDFAREDSGTAAATTPSRFYWASNAAFFTSGVRIGKRGVDNGAVSMLGSDVAPADRVRSLTGLLGSPGSALNMTQAGVTYDTLWPSAARAGVVLHSAGEDGAFLPKLVGGSPTVKDAGTGQCYNGIMDFGQNFLDPQAGNAPLPASVDLAKKFNDIIVGAGT